MICGLQHEKRIKREEIMKKNFLLFLIAIVLAYLAYDGLVSGEVLRQSGSWLPRDVEKDQNPIEFWMEITTLILLSFSSLCLFFANLRSKNDRKAPRALCHGKSIR